MKTHVDPDDSSLASILQRLHDSEINGSIEWFFDGVWTVRLGDNINGWRVSAVVDTLREAETWLDEQARELYPDSAYARSSRA
jgi:hypothetical protein